MPEQQRRPVSHLTNQELDRYGGQLLRCLKALGTDAPIRPDVQQELADVRAVQDTRSRSAADG
jgi:hypothetical protein